MTVLSHCNNLVKALDKVTDTQKKVELLNTVRSALHEISPMKDEPVDCVLWIPIDEIKGNDYNPNTVAPPEMELLHKSISEDGYTQPVVVVREDEGYTVIDGFHRSRVLREKEDIKEKVMGYLPVTKIRDTKTGRNSRIASTIRHNRARGKHGVDAMSEIVLELKNRNWKNARISRELGMDEEEILRLCQITGLEDIFKDGDFSRAWLIEDNIDDFVPLTDEITEVEKEEQGFRTTNTSDPTRIFHTFDKWECAKAGFYSSRPPDGMTKTECENEYAVFLSNTPEFRKALRGVVKDWKRSCEHYLTNKSMNRIAWLGQASMCYAKGISSEFRAGFNLLSEDQQNTANQTAYKTLKKWLVDNGLETVGFDEALSVKRQVEIY